MPNSSKGYYASARTGGFGDLDIYKVHYMITDAPECKPGGESLAINAMPDQVNPMAYNISLTVPEEQKNNIRSYAWMINGKATAETKETFHYNFEKPDSYVITAKVVAACDTCPSLMAFCSEKTIEVKNNLLTSADENADKQTGLAKHESSKGKKTPGKKQNQKPDKNVVASRNEQFSDKENEKDNIAANDNNGKNKNKSGENATSASGETRRLSEDELKAMNWNTSPQLFGLNVSAVSEDTKPSLEQNANLLKENKELKVTITGHADSRGSNAYNKALSLRRAQAVKQYFIEHGVKNSQIKAVKGKGEEELVNNCSDGVTCDESQHAQNRRVEVEVTGKAVKGAGHITQK
jgi:outer membrane protein OmpA-like peptidoglycan-associated protein